ncbi:MAG: hypothetical protein ACHQHN_05390 [Sphingobacteriales bacterium]
MRSIFSKAVMTAVALSIFAINVQATTTHGMAADTGKMAKMDKMSKMDKKKMDKKKMSKMKKDTTKM